MKRKVNENLDKNELLCVRNVETVCLNTLPSIFVRTFNAKCTRKNL